jgi:hypothetical protein
MGAKDILHAVNNQLEIIASASVARDLCSKIGAAALAHPLLSARRQYV